MNKLLLLTFLFVTSLLGQVPTSTSRIPLTIPPVYVGQFNGTSQYFSKTSPSKMDLNGSEQSTNGNFESGVTGWTGTRGTLASDADTLHGGSGSAKLTSDGTAPNAFINNTSVISNATTTKVTLEAWLYVPVANTSKTVAIAIRDQLGNTIAQGGNQVLTPDTWTKLVLNAQLPGTQTGLLVLAQLQSNPASGDILFIDDVSLTRGWDGVVQFEAKTTSGSTQTLAGSSKTNSSRLRIWQNTATASVTLTDGTTSVTATNSATINDGRYHKWGVTWSKTGNLTLYIDGVAGTGQSITGVGAITVDTLWIGRDQAGNYFNGQIGEKVRARYSSLPPDIAPWIAYANTQRFIPEPPGGGETVLRIFGKRNDAYDQSGNQGVLTNTGSTPIIQKQ